MAKEYLVKYGQSIFDVAIENYGNIESIWLLIDDNEFGDGVNTNLEGGQVLSVRTGTAFSANTISEYFSRYPSIVNNSDYDQTDIIDTLALILKQIQNETNGNDGFILIDVDGGKPDFSFTWTNQDTGQIVGHSQNLVASSSGTFSVTVVDGEGNEATLSNLVISVTDNTVYLVDEFGNIITDEFGNPIIVV